MFLSQRAVAQGSEGRPLHSPARKQLVSTTERVGAPMLLLQGTGKGASRGSKGSRSPPLRALRATGPWSPLPQGGGSGKGAPSPSPQKFRSPAKG